MTSYYEPEPVDTVQWRGHTQTPPERSMEGCTNICEIAERMRPHANPPIPKAERVSDLGFRIGDRVRILNNKPSFKDERPIYEGPCVITAIDNGYADGGRSEYVCATSEIDPRYGFISLDVNLVKLFG